MTEYEGRLYERVLDQLFEQLGNQSTPSKTGLRLDIVPGDQPLQRWQVGFVEILVDHLADRLDHLDPLEGTRDRDLFSLVVNRWRAVDALRQVDHERFGQLHH